MEMGLTLKGSQVYEVSPGSPALLAGISPGDVFDKIAEWSVPRRPSSSSSLPDLIWERLDNTPDPVPVILTSSYKKPAACATVSCSANSGMARAPRKAWGFELPPGWSAQHAEALGGYLSLAIARRMSRMRIRHLQCKGSVYIVVDSEVLVALICAAYGDPLNVAYREMAPWIPAFRALLLDWDIVLWII